MLIYIIICKDWNGYRPPSRPSTSFRDNCGRNEARGLAIVEQMKQLSTTSPSSTSTSSTGELSNNYSKTDTEKTPQFSFLQCDASLLGTSRHASLPSAPPTTPSTSSFSYRESHPCRDTLQPVKESNKNLLSTTMVVCCLCNCSSPCCLPHLMRGS